LIASDSTEPYFRADRGFARALIGDIDGAIEDYQFFVDHTPDTAAKECAQIELNILKAGKNPFTPEKMEDWR
jgi:regulator of sirC expression with transglutaminase-like and TPR domain